jgi:UDP-galactopyranose mutase
MGLDYLIVGAGLYGATFARYMLDRGKKCLVIDKRSHIAGNVFTKKQLGIDVHKYGPHIFHTNSKKIWDYVNQFADFNDYRHKVMSMSGGNLYSFPINLKTLESLWGDIGDEALLRKFQESKTHHNAQENLEQWAIAEVGNELYQKFIYGYTKKQWGESPADLPKSIITRIPVRTNRDDNYHECTFSGIPKSGYTPMVEKMLDGTEVVLEQDYLERRSYWEKLAKRILYTGPIDEFFEYKYKQMKWRSLRFEEKILNKNKVQSVAQVNYADESIPFTRSVEHKHFTWDQCKDIDQTVVTLEYPQEYEKNLEKYYPICDEVQIEIFNKYKKLIPRNYIFGGRLADYKYYDMDQVIAAALKKAESCL